jgi:hypothetical protein
MRGDIDDALYRLLAGVVTLCLAPLLVPLFLYIGATYSWEDTVPTSEDS